MDIIDLYCQNEVTKKNAVTAADGCRVSDANPAATGCFVAVPIEPWRQKKPSAWRRRLMRNQGLKRKLSSPVAAALMRTSQTPLNARPWPGHCALAAP